MLFAKKFGPNFRFWYPRIFFQKIVQICFFFENTRVSTNLWKFVFFCKNVRVDRIFQVFKIKIPMVVPIKFSKYFKKYLIFSSSLVRFWIKKKTFLGNKMIIFVWNYEKIWLFFNFFIQKSHWFCIFC